MSIHSARCGEATTQGMIFGFGFTSRGSGSKINRSSKTATQDYSPRAVRSDQDQEIDFVTKSEAAALRNLLRLSTGWK
jgi:hypothetical protein